MDFNNWFKGNLEGITTKDLNAILNFKDKFSYNIFTQVVLLDYLEQKAQKNKNINIRKINKKKFPKRSFVAMLNNLKKLIMSLELKKSKTTWDDYSKNNTYELVANVRYKKNNSFANRRNKYQNIS